MANNIRVKVSVEALKKRVNEQRAVAVRERETQAARAERDFADWQKKAHAAINKQKIEEYDRVPGWSPRKLADLTRFDRDLRLLDMVEDAAITITTTSEYYKYL